MAPRYKNKQVDVTFVHGIDQSADDRVASPAYLKTAENVTIGKRGQLTKRGGIVAETMLDRSGGAVSGTPRRLATADGELVCITDTELHARADTASRWANRGPVPEINYPEQRHVSASTHASERYSCGTVANGWAVYAWLEVVGPWDAAGATYTGDVKVAVVDDATGTVLFEETLASSGNAAKVTIYKMGDYVFVYWLDTTPTPLELNVARLDTSTTPTAFDTPVVLMTDVYAPALGSYDIDDDGTSMFVAYDASATPLVKVAVVSTVPALGASATVAAERGATVAIRYHAALDRLWVAWANSTNFTRFSSVNPGTLAATAAFTVSLEFAVSIAIEPVSSTEAVFAFSYGTTVGGVVYFATNTIKISSTPAAASVASVCPHLALASRLWTYSGVVYGVFVRISIEGNSSYFVCAVTSHQFFSRSPLRMCAVLAPSQASGLIYIATMQMLNAPVESSSGVFHWAAALDYKPTDANGEPGVSATAAWTWSHVDPKRATTDELAKSLFISGGVLSAYDGNVVHEAGFAWSPDAVYCKATPAAGANNWKYRFVYEWIDAKGQRWRSAPSLPVDASAGALPVTLQIQTLSLTNKHRPGVPPEGRPVAVHAYRTKHNGTTYYLVTSSEVGPIENIPTAPTVSLSDTLVDAAIADNESLYTDGGVIENSLVLAASDVLSHQGRLFAAQGDRVQFSKQWVEGDAPGFAPPDEAGGGQFILRVPGRESIEALTALDEAIIIAKPSKLFYATGEGPTDQGIDRYTEPKALSTDLGCSDRRSVVATPAGIVYQSARGMYLLPRGFGPVQWLGERARDHLDTYPTVNGATVDQANGLAVFTTIGASAGALLIWDYLRNEWMTWTATPGDRKFSTVTYYDGALHFMTPDVTALYSYTPGVFVDDADPFIPTLVETNRIRTSGFVTGWARNSYVRIVGEYQGPCTLTVDVAYNDGAYTTTKSWNLDSPLAAGDTVERELVLPIQLSKSVQFRVSDAEYDANGGTGGLTLIAMSVGVAARQSHGAPFDAAKRG